MAVARLAAPSHSPAPAAFTLHCGVQTSEMELLGNGQLSLRQPLRFHFSTHPIITTQSRLSASTSPNKTNQPTTNNTP